MLGYELSETVLGLAGQQVLIRDHITPPLKPRSDSSAGRALSFLPKGRSGQDRAASISGGEGAWIEMQEKKPATGMRVRARSVRVNSKRALTLWSYFRRNPMPVFRTSSAAVAGPGCLRGYRPDDPIEIGLRPGIAVDRHVLPNVGGG